MSSINLVLVGLAMFGFLPLGIILFKKGRVKRILSTGLSATATVYTKGVMSRSAAEIVYYSFYAPDSKQYTGKLMVERDKYNIGDHLEIFYLANNPKRNTMNGAWGSPLIIIFGIVIALMILFASYKMYEMVQNGSM